MKATPKTKTRATRTRKQRRKPEPVNVAPVVVQTGNSPDEAFIPATVRTTPDSAEAVISVEVKRGNKTRKRAAVVPIALKKRIPSQPQPPQQHKKDIRWSDPVTDTVVGATRVLDRMVNLANQFGHTALDTFEGVSRAFFARAMVVKKAAERDQLTDLNVVTLMESPRRAERELRAA